MFIQVRASAPQPHKGTYTPNRFWTNGETRRLEVIDDEVVEKQLKPQAKGREDKAARHLEIAAGPFLEDGTPDPTRITKAGHAMIRANPFLSTLEDGETQGTLSNAAVDTARAVAAKANAELTDVKIENGELLAKIAELTKANAELTDRITELEEAATAPPSPDPGK